MEYLSGFANFLTLEQAVSRIANNDFSERVELAFTFDDGYSECYDLIAPVLEEFDTRGAFFINANYVDSDAEYQAAYHDRVIVYTKTPMTWQQIEDLHQRGHLIGSHTLDHYNMAELSAESIETQVKQNKTILESKLDYSCDHFAWPFGGMQHFPDQALEICQKYHKYIYSGTDYKQYHSRQSAVLNRRHLEPFWPKSHLRYFLSHQRS